jgi:hypothetical protein
VAVLVWFALNLVAVVWCTRAIVLRLRPDARRRISPFSRSSSRCSSRSRRQPAQRPVNFIVLALSVFAALAGSRWSRPLAIALKILPLVLALLHADEAGSGRSSAWR